MKKLLIFILCAALFAYLYLHGRGLRLSFAAAALLFLFFLLLYRLTSFFTHGKSGERAGFIFLALSLTILLMPLTHFNMSDKDETENRKLTPLPHFMIGDSLNPKIGRELESYFGDRFRFRNELLDIHHTLENKLAKKNSQALIGLDGWLFYRGDNSERLFMKSIHFSQKDLERIAVNLKARQSWLAAQGCEYFLLVAPDKSSVYGEFYSPGLIPPNSPNRVEELLYYLDAQNISPHLRYVLPELLSHKEEGELLYYKTDTHWNEYGAYWGYLALMEEICAKYPELTPVNISANEWERYDQATGDLVNMLALRDVPPTTYLRPKPIAGWHFKYLKNEGRTGVHTVNPQKSLRVLMFRDSFTTALVPYISETFGEVEYIWDNDMNSPKNQEKIKSFKPDIVIQETVSRYVHVLSKDTPFLER